MPESKPQPNKKSIKRTTVAFNEEIVEEIDRFAQAERTDRSNLLNSLLWVILKTPNFAQKIAERKREEEHYEITLAQIVQEALFFYFEHTINQELKEEAEKTHRNSRQMMEYLIELGWQKYREQNKN